MDEMNLLYGNQETMLVEWNLPPGMVANIDECNHRFYYPKGSGLVVSGDNATVDLLPNKFFYMAPNRKHVITNTSNEVVSMLEWTVTESPTIGE